MGSFKELERRISAMQNPTSNAPAYDLCGFFPEPEKAVTIEIEGFEPLKLGAPLMEPVAGLIMNVQLMRGNTEVFSVTNLADVAAIYAVVKWDAERRYLKVRRNDDAYASKVATRNENGVTIATMS